MSYQNPKWPTGTIFTKQNWHFHKRLFERYGGISLLPGEFTSILNKITNSEIQPVITYNRGIPVGVYKYIHMPGTKHQKRIYLLAKCDGSQLISVEKPDWVHQKTNTKTRQKPRQIA